MAIVRFEPFRGFENLARKFYHDSDLMGSDFSINAFSPRIDISEDDKALALHCEIPGINKEDVKISVSDERILTIKGEKKREEKAESKNFVRVERAFGSFERSFMLPDNVNQEQINAKFDNGILTIDMPKMEPAKPKEIEVKIS